MQISDYMPNFYKNNTEYLNIINTEEAEFENRLKVLIDASFLDTFANISTSEGIAKFEKIFNIKVSSDDSLEFRRERIMNRLISHTPFTEKYLIDKLNQMLGEGNWNYTLDYNNYELEITSLIPGKSWYFELISFLNKTIPCNVDWKIYTYTATWGIVKDSFISWNDIKSKTWQELLDGEWIITKGVRYGKI